MEAAESSSKRQKVGTSISMPDMTEMLTVIAKTTNSPWLAFNLLRMSFVQFATAVNQNFSLTDGDKQLLNHWLKKLPDYQSKYDEGFGYSYEHAAAKDAPFVFQLMLLLDQQTLDVSYLWLHCFQADSAKVLAILSSRFPLPNEVSHFNSFSFPTKCATLLGGEEIWKYIDRERFKRDMWTQLSNYLQYPQNGFDPVTCNRLKQDLQPYTFADLRLHFIHHIRFCAEENVRAVDNKTKWIKEIIPPEWAEETVDNVLLRTSLRFPDIESRVVTATTLCKIFDLDPNLVSRGVMDNDECRPIAQLRVDGCIAPDPRPLSRTTILHLAKIEIERFSWADIFNLDPVNHQQVVMVFLTYREVPSDAETRAKILQLVLREDPFVIGTDWVTTYSSLALLRNLKRLGYNISAFGESAYMLTFWRGHSSRLEDWIRVAFLEDTSQSTIQNKRNAQAWFVSYINSHDFRDYDLCKQLRVVHTDQKQLYWAKHLNKNNAQVIGQTVVYPFSPLELFDD